MLALSALLLSLAALALPYGGSVQNQFESTVHKGYATLGTGAARVTTPRS